MTGSGPAGTAGFSQGGVRARSGSDERAAGFTLGNDGVASPAVSSCVQQPSDFLSVA